MDRVADERKGIWNNNRDVFVGTKSLRSKGRGLRGQEFLRQILHQYPQIVTDSSNAIETHAGGVIQFPVGVLLARVDWANVAAPHRDDSVDCLDHLVGPRLGEFFT